MCAALNPFYPASFGLSSNAVAAVAAAAAAAVFSNNSTNAMAQAISSNNPSGTTTSVLQSPTASAPNYHEEKVEWMNRIENSHIDRGLMNKIIMNYLVNEGFKEAAEIFRSETGIYYPFDTNSLDQRIKIREAIEMGNIPEAIDLIKKLNPDLMDANRLLAFHLQQQHLIELIRNKRLEEALAFAQDHLCEYGERNEAMQEELERTMALLAFDDPLDSPFSELLQPLQRHKLACEANSAILELENFEATSKLNILVNMLIWSQDLLDKRSVSYPKMKDIANARVEEASGTLNVPSNN